MLMKMRVKSCRYRYFNYAAYSFSKNRELFMPRQCSDRIPTTIPSTGMHSTQTQTAQHFEAFQLKTNSMWQTHVRVTHPLLLSKYNGFNFTQCS